MKKEKKKFYNDEIIDDVFYISLGIRWNHYLLKIYFYVKTKKKMNEWIKAGL